MCQECLIRVEQSTVFYSGTPLSPANEYPYQSLQCVKPYSSLCDVLQSLKSLLTNRMYGLRLFV